MQKLSMLIEDVFNVRLSDLSDDTDLKMLDLWDSLNHMIFITSLEREFDIELTPEEIVNMTNIKAIKSVLDSRMEQSE